MWVYICRPIGDVAQLVEQWIENPCVGGSIPSITTTYIGNLLIPSVLEAQLHTWCTIWGLSMPDGDFSETASLCVNLQGKLLRKTTQSMRRASSRFGRFFLQFYLNSLIISFVSYLFR
jgi:hypothetical protein